MKKNNDSPNDDDGYGSVLYQSAVLYNDSPNNNDGYGSGHYQSAYYSNSYLNDDDGYDQNGTVSTNTISHDDECNNYYRQ
jgi:hypothetical protein